MRTHLRIQELANNLEIENSLNKSHAKISGFTVARSFLFACNSFLHFLYGHRSNNLLKMPTTAVYTGVDDLIQFQLIWAISVFMISLNFILS